MRDSPTIDKAKILAEMDKLAEEASDWRDHLPYEALLEIHRRDDVRVIYDEHSEALDSFTADSPRSCIDEIGGQ